MASAGQGVASVSVDLDPIGCYYRIHALGAPPSGLADVVLRRALPRYLDLFARRGVRATFFVVGRELDGQGASAQAARALIRDAQAAGHEVGNHSFTHPYDLARLPAPRLAMEIERAHQVLGETTGTAPVGFRAPGYGVSGAVFEELARLGYRYDSSIFPAPGYWLAKAAVMGALRLTGGKSGAILSDPRGLLAPPDPYRPDLLRPWRPA